MKKLIWLLLLLTLIACGPATITTPTVTPVPSSTPAPMATSTSAPTATSTPIAGAPIEQCVEILPEFPEGSVPSGTLVVRILTKGISLLDFQQQTQRLIPGYFDGVGTSPNGKWLAYASRYNNAELIVESLNGEKKVLLFPYDRNWFIFGNPWLGNDWLSYVVSGGGLDLKTVAINPFTGEQKLLLPDYPDFIRYWNNPGDIPLYFDSSNVLYDPSLRFVIYPKDKETEDGLYTALWDRETNQEIAKVLNGGNTGWPPPIWFSDGHGFVVAAYPKKDIPQEWFMVNIDGKVSQLTHLGDQFANHDFGNAVSLSPDGRYLAFGLYIGKSTNNEPKELIILDLQTLDAINTCIPLYDGWYSLLWSPDGQYLVTEYADPNPRLPAIVVLNVDAGWGARIMLNDNKNEYRYPVGWLASGE